MKIKLNDKEIEVVDGCSLTQALDQAGITPKGIATAVNNKVVPRTERDNYILHPGDDVVIINAFYGG